MNKWNFKQALIQTQSFFLSALHRLNFANTCVMCQHKTEGPDSLVCHICIADLDRFELGYDFLLQNPTGASQIKHSHIAGLAVVSEYVWPFSQFISSVKFHQANIHAKWFGQLLQQQVVHQMWPRIDKVVPLPLHPLREFKRGYNQAYLIAKHMTQLNSKIALNLLKRTKYTKAQSGLNKKQRQRNLARAFECVGEVSGLTILLIDDVVTTGNSVNEAAKALIEKGATAVYVAAVAIRTLD